MDIPVEGLLEVDQDDGSVTVRIMSTDNDRMVSIVIQRDKVLAIESVHGRNPRSKCLYSLEHSAFGD